MSTRRRLPHLKPKQFHVQNSYLLYFNCKQIADIIFKYKQTADITLRCKQTADITLKYKQTANIT